MEDKIKKLGELKETAKKIIAEYNKLALEIDHNKRLALASNGSWRDGESSMTHEEYMQDQSDNRYVGGDLDPLGASAWFSSFASDC